jgi:hypothetical protein
MIDIVVGLIGDRNTVDGLKGVVGQYTGMLDLIQHHRDLVLSRDSTSSFDYIYCMLFVFYRGTNTIMLKSTAMVYVWRLYTIIIRCVKWI